MSTLVKRMENDTDFDVCVWKVKSGKYVVTVYDTVERTHDKQGAFDTEEEATSAAKDINDGYMTGGAIRLDERDLQKMINDAVRKVLRENAEYDNDLDYDRIFDAASHFIANNPNVPLKWRLIAKALGFRMDTIGQNDMELLKDAIEDAMAENETEETNTDNDLDESTDIDTDSYYGGGLPEQEPKAHTTTYEKEFSEIYGKVKPYITRLAFLLNNNDIDRETYDKVMDALETLDSLPSIGKNLTTTEID